MRRTKASVYLALPFLIVAGFCFLLCRCGKTETPAPAVQPTAAPVVIVVQPTVVPGPVIEPTKNPNPCLRTSTPGQYFGDCAETSTCRADLTRPGYFLGHKCVTR